MDTASMPARGDDRMFTRHIATTVIFDQLACHGARTAKRGIVPERRRSD